jgi:transcriptional regulator with XRE-family HTH domain
MAVKELDSYGVPMRDRTWADYLRVLIEDSGLTHAEIARRAGVDKTQIGRWLAGATAPRTGTPVVRLARSLGASEDEALRAAGLVPDDEPPSRPSDEDIELRVIRESDAPDRVKATLIAYVHRRRAEQERERMEAVRLALESQP